MGTTRLRRPPAPSDAERARSVAARGGTASLAGTGAPASTPLVHQVWADGSAALLLEDGDPVLELLRGHGGELSAMLELTDRAPVDLREPIRALLWLTGRIRLPDAEAARRIAVQVADAHPHPDLLRLGHGATLVRLDAGLRRAVGRRGHAALAPVELAAARPDPSAATRSTGWRTSSGRTPRCSTPWPATCRPRCATGGGPGAAAGRGPLRAAAAGGDLRGDHDVRLAWRDGAHTVAELRTQMGLLVGCPFRDPRGAPLS